MRLIDELPIRPRRELVRKASAFWNAQFGSNDTVLGVHLRGTDKPWAKASAGAKSSNSSSVSPTTAEKAKEAQQQEAAAAQEEEAAEKAAEEEATAAQQQEEAAAVQQQEAAAAEKATQAAEEAAATKAKLEAAAPKKPHIVISLVDDLGWADVGFNKKNPHAYTPFVDKLAASGSILDRHYGYAFCSPSRSSLMSGRLPHHVNQFNPDMPDAVGGIDLRMRILPGLMKAAPHPCRIHAPQPEPERGLEGQPTGPRRGHTSRGLQCPALAGGQLVGMVAFICHVAREGIAERSTCHLTPTGFLQHGDGGQVALGRGADVVAAEEPRLRQALWDADGLDRPLEPQVGAGGWE